MCEKSASPKVSNRLPGIFLTGKSITNTNTSMNIRKNSKSSLDVSIGTRRICLKKKTGEEKSHDTDPLRFQMVKVQKNKTLR